MPRFRIDQETSTLLVSARSTVGPITFEARDLSGWIDIDFTVRPLDDRSARDTAAELTVQLSSLRSGNDLYDAELRRRIDARRFPTCELRLERAEALAPERYALGGTISFHGATKPLSGTVDVELLGDDRLAVSGATELDIRDFGMQAPTMLMMKIYPEVQVQLFVAAVVDPNPGGSA